LRSYHVSSERIRRELGWTPKRTVEDAVVGMCKAFRENRIPGALTDIRYVNVKTVQAAGLV
jgi:dTDP-D-glucose 4,6-dehydratase